MRNFMLIFSAIFFWLVAAEKSSALELGSPSGPVLLEARGRITADGGVARFDFEQLKKLGVVSVTTKTPWTDHQVVFEAVPGKALLEALGAQGTTLSAKAINDYKVEIPIEDLRDKGAFIAFSMDGKRLTVRDKGPLWLLYPFSDRQEVDNPIYYNRAIWQLTHIEVR